MIPFHTTQLGYRFFDSTMPKLVAQLTRMNDLLERLVVAVEKQATTEPQATPTRTKEDAP